MAVKLISDRFISFKLRLHQPDNQSIGWLGNQIVVRVADDFDSGEFADRQLAAHVNASVNVRRIGFAAANKVIDLSSGWHDGSVSRIKPCSHELTFAPCKLFRVRLAFDENLDFAADKRFGNLHGDFVLRGHGQFAALLFHLVGNLAGHRAGARAVFLGIGKHAEPLEFGFADEIQQRVEARLRLAGKTDDERRPQRDAGNAGADGFGSNPRCIAARFRGASVRACFRGCAGAACPRSARLFCNRRSSG